MNEQKVLSQDTPYFIYKRFKFDCSGELIHPLNYGYAFYLERLIVKHPMLNQLNKVLGIEIEMVNHSRGRDLQNIAYNPGVISSPLGSANDGIEDIKYTTSPAPVDDKAYNLSSTASTYIKPIKLKNFYMFKDVLIVRFHWMEYQTEDQPLDVCLCGKLLPQRDLTMWKN